MTTTSREFLCAGDFVPGDAASVMPAHSMREESRSPQYRLDPHRALRTVDERCGDTAAQRAGPSRSLVRADYDDFRVSFPGLFQNRCDRISGRKHRRALQPERGGRTRQLWSDGIHGPSIAYGVKRHDARLAQRSQIAGRTKDWKPRLGEISRCDDRMGVAGLRSDHEDWPACRAG